MVDSITVDKLVKNIMGRLSWKICLVYLDDIIEVEIPLKRNLRNLEEFRYLHEIDLLLYFLDK